jgi:quercetin dioxygenase-like cupin family protein
MFYQQNNQGYKQILPGIDLKTLVHGEKTLLAEFHLQRDSQLPRHAHPQEQTGYLISGHIRLTIGGETFDVQPGDGWCIPANLEHQAEIVVDSIALEVFSPAREDYLAYNLLKS